MVYVTRACFNHKIACWDVRRMSIRFCVLNWVECLYDKCSLVCDWYTVITLISWCRTCVQFDSSTHDMRLRRGRAQKNYLAFSISNWVQHLRDHTGTGTSFAFTARVRELSKCCCCTDTLTLTHHHDILNSICTRACDGMTQYTQQKHMCYKAINNAYQQTSLCVCGTVLRTHLAKFQAETHSHTQKSNLSFFIDFKLNIRKHAIVQNERSVWSRLELFIVYTT